MAAIASFWALSKSVRRDCFAELLVEGGVAACQAHANGNTSKEYISKYLKVVLAS